MKVLVVFLSLAASAFSSLEPTGYRPPGSYRPSHQYLSPSDQPSFPSSQYLPSTFGSPSNSPFIKTSAPLEQQPPPSSQYLPQSFATSQNVQKNSSPANQYIPPPPSYLPPDRQPSTISPPSTNYLPPKDFSEPQRTNYLPPNFGKNGLNSNYLPPDESRGGATYKLQGIQASWPKISYLAPSGNDDTSDFRRGSSGTTPASSYVTPQSTIGSSTFAPVTPSTNFVPPKENRPATNFKPAQESREALPTSNYLPPVGSLEAPSNYNSPAVSTPTSNYLPPKESQGPVSKTEDKPKAIITIIATTPAPATSPAYFGNQPTKYSNPQFSLRPDVDTNSLEQGRSFAKTYPAPSVRNSYQEPSINYLPANQYDYAASGAFGNSVESAGPSKYNFEYQVSDEFGNDFGHKETRLGSNAQGVYSVLMPDGRKQIVQYEADEGGFKPRISYEEANDFAKSSFAGYDRNANNIDAQGPY